MTKKTKVSKNIIKFINNNLFTLLLSNKTTDESSIKSGIQKRRMTSNSIQYYNSVKIQDIEKAYEKYDEIKNLIKRDTKHDNYVLYNLLCYIIKQNIE